MAVKRIVVHCVEIVDKAGSLQRLLAQAAEAGVDFMGFIACSVGGGVGRACLSAKNPASLEEFTKASGIEATESVGFVIEGDNHVGAAAEALKGLADAGISGATGAACVCDGRFHMMITVAGADGDAAEKALAG